MDYERHANRAKLAPGATAMTLVNNPFTQFFERSGAPLLNGQIFIGDAGLDAQSNPIPVYWDDAFTIPAPQPIRTLNGYPVWNGAPAKMFVNASDFSMTVQDARGALVFSSLQQADVVPSGGVANVREYGAVGDNNADDTASFALALLSGLPVYVPPGTYKITAPLTISTNGQSVFGNGQFQSVIAPVGNFNVFTMANAVDGPAVEKLSINCAAMTGGFALSVMGADRWRFRDIRILSGWSVVYCQASNNGLIENVYASNLKGSVVIRWFGNALFRSDGLDVVNSYFSADASVSTTQIGFDWDGNCWSPHFYTVLFLDGARGIWKRNTSGAALAGGLGNFVNVNCEDQAEYSVYIEDAQGYAFVNSYLFGADIDAFYIGATASDIRVSNSIVGGTNGYAFNIQSGAREISVSNCDLTSSTLGAWIDFGGGSNNNICFDSNQGSNVEVANQVYQATAGWGAAATATISAGAVTGLTLNRAGWNYESPPLVSFIGGGGSGASATATVSGGKVTGFTLVGGGTGFTSAPRVRLQPISQAPSIGSFSQSGPAISTNLAIKAADSGVLEVGNETAISAQFRTDRIDALLPLRLPLFTIATLPAASSVSRAIVYVSDGTSSRRVVVSDGIVWRYMDGVAA